MKEDPLQSLKLGLVGNPVQHSLSPQIHQQFASQLGQPIDYQKYRVEAAKLASFINQFFAGGGTGLNITLPFKQQVIPFLDKLTAEAQIAQSVNTVFRGQNHQLIGATTDGQGLLIDLAQLRFEVAEKKILIIGAGGASQSIIAALLQADARLAVINRTPCKVDQLKRQFAAIGEIEDFDPASLYHGVISSISEFNAGLITPVASAVEPNGFFYDLNYGHRASQLKEFVSQLQGPRFADGVGMLINQAALSFQLWSGKMPDTASIKLA